MLAGAASQVRVMARSAEIVLRLGIIVSAVVMLLALIGAAHT